MQQESPNVPPQEAINFEIAFQVGEWTVEPGLNRISKIEGDQVIERLITPKVMTTCVFLAKHSPSTVTQNQLAENVWPGQAISDSSIYQVIAQLRKAFDDVKSTKHYVERISSKGYRMNASVFQSSTVPPLEQYKKLKQKRLIIAGALATVLAIIVIISVKLQEQVNKPTISLLSQLQSVAITRAKNHTTPKIQRLDIFNDLLMSQLIKIKSLRIVSLRDDSLVPETDVILTTTIQNQGNKIQISVQLLATETNQVLWAEIFNGKMSKLFSIQEKISKKLSKIFQTTSQTSKLESTIEVNNEIYLQYILALHLWNQKTPNSLMRAKQIYTKILSEEPRYTKALVGLCNSYLALYVYSNWSKEKSIAMCQPLIDEAYHLSPESGQVLATKATLFAYNKNNQQAHSYFKRAIEQAPNYAFAFQWYGTFLRNNGDYQEALKMHQHAFTLAPLSPSIIRSLAYSHLNLRQLKKARKLYQRSLTIEPYYSHRALQELDFLPLNVERARNFLGWVKNEKQNPTMLPVYQLTHVLVLLSANKIKMAENILASLEAENLNPAFHLYVQAALAAAKNNLSLAVKKLKQRVDFSPQITRYVMPYIAALHANRDSKKSLETFRKYFPEINTETPIDTENYQMFVFLNGLLDKERMDEADIGKKLIIFFDTHLIPETALGKIFWYNQRGKKTEAKKAIDKLLSRDWLPDYNDNIFVKKNIREIYISSGGQALDWAKKIEYNQARASD